MPSWNKTNSLLATTLQCSMRVKTQALLKLDMLEIRVKRPGSSVAKRRYRATKAMCMEIKKESVNAPEILEI